jgi:hypothetical protein
MTPLHPEYPFQHICSDFFSLQGHNFCLVVDRFSNWLQVFTGKGGAHNRISLLGQCFHSFGIPETLPSDGGPEYTAGSTQEFLKKLGVHHRLISVGFPHANHKAEYQQSNMMTNTGGNIINTNALTNTMMNTNMMKSNVMTNDSGYLNNEGYSCYGDYSP